MLNHCDVRKGVWVTNLLINAKEKKGFFRKQFSKFWSSDNSDLQIKRSLQNKTTDYNNYICIKTILLTQIYLFVTVSNLNFCYPTLFCSNVVCQYSTCSSDKKTSYIHMTTRQLFARIENHLSNYQSSSKSAIKSCRDQCKATLHYYKSAVLKLKPS